MGIIRQDSFESRLVARLVQERFSYRTIHLYLHRMKYNNTKNNQSLRYHADAHNVSLSDSRNSLKGCETIARSISNTMKLQLKRG